MSAMSLQQQTPMVVLVCCDALSRDWIDPAHTPVLSRLAAQGTWCAQHRAVFPSVTRVSAASIATGCTPERHGLHGNRMGLFEQGKVRVYDVGHPDFRTHLRRATGRTLKVPTLAERVAPVRGFVAMSNVSPGAAYFLDPDHFGTVYHRAGSFLPGGDAVPAADALTIGQDFEGDRQMTARFCDEVLRTRKPSVAVLWLAHPDATLHGAPLGSPAHLDALRHADRCVEEVMQTVRALRAEGEDVLLLVTSDHGQETIGDSVDIEVWLSEQGLAALVASGDLAVAAQGTSALVYATPEGERAFVTILDALRAQPWAGAVKTGEALLSRGVSMEEGVIAAIDMGYIHGTNDYGVEGKRWAAAEPGKVKRPGFGEHGGWGPDETRPFLIVDRIDAQASTLADATSLTDIAPTVLDYLGIPASGMQGRSLLR
ncbi:nucleotide pyrophosphatase [Pandoraea aquatica]|uniref:Nucleotide pyrophosphatase n=1 Tax=Pandoraea aquatica TaxID=2508290 RepID=A0A5E4RSB5_9BURK|nr:alkaline phosphatase family protein [Pandoraea aquatica]VVD65324.1 nucleotide pyrophosphatase [Pandoraea aquatica]